ncbi:MDR family MFS transporter [Pseudoalteromonas aurantia]|uniref:MFS transporter n=1 Tax=Pseudoalteromonas aurantia TaxID=43654 RepID=A0ABY2VT53_9GAMM|nr:MFS transporter [Pseudoalteromonas aurantia]TMO59832.1 MFS transporter [Pseudoalteromonas aurantia]TMO70974.1 MFS transporter [Pseudoalteromonas aurantia]
MDRGNVIAQLGNFTPLVWVMLLGNFFVRATYYMVWPFLSVLLYQKYDLSATEVGLLLTISAVVSVLFGFYTGNLADRYGRFKLLYVAVLVGIFAFSALALADSLWSFCFAVFLATMPRSLWDAPSKAVLSDELKDDKDRELALHMLYFLVNVGAALGPLYGLWAGLNGEQFSFIYTAISYLGLCIALLLMNHSRAANITEVSSSSTPPNFFSWLGILKKDTVFLLVLAANLLIYFVFAQGDSSLIQYLARAEVPELATLVSLLIVTNSAVIVLFQFPLLHVMRHWSIQTRLYCGGAILVVSQILMALNPVDYFTGWIVCVFVLSVSEAIMFSNINVHIDRLAPEHLKASYFGAAGLCSLGFALAPLLGGLVLDMASGPVLFIVTSVISMTALLIYHIAQSTPRYDTKCAIHS